ncbi:hypothetical protein FA95DRAFT_1578406, partial [Auriscalpium vulgare]
MVLTRNQSAAASQGPAIVVPVSTAETNLSDTKPFKASTKKTTRKTTRKSKTNAKVGGNNTASVTQTAAAQEVPTFQQINSLGENIAQAEATAERARSAESDVFSGHYTLASERLGSIPAVFPRQPDGFQPRKLTYAQAVSRSPSPVFVLHSAYLARSCANLPAYSQSSDVVYYDPSPLDHKSRMRHQSTSTVLDNGATGGLSIPDQGTTDNKAVPASAGGVPVPSTTAQHVMSPTTVHNTPSKRVPATDAGAPKPARKGKTSKPKAKTSGEVAVVITKTKPSAKKPVLSPPGNKTDTRAAKRTGPAPRMRTAPSTGSSSSQQSSSLLEATNSLSTDSDSPSMPTPERIVSVPVPPVRPAHMSTGGKQRPRAKPVTIVTADHNMEDVQPELPPSPIVPAPDVAHLFDDDVQVVGATQCYASDSEPDRRNLGDADCTTDRGNIVDANSSDGESPNDAAEQVSMDVDDGHDAHDHTQSSEHMSPPPSTQPGSKRSHNMTDSGDEPPKKRRAVINQDKTPPESSQGTTRSDSSVVLLSPPEQQYDKVMRANWQEEILKDTYKSVPQLRYTELIDEEIFMPYMFTRVNNPEYPRVILSDLIKLIEFTSHAGTNIYNPSRADPSRYKTRTNPNAKAYTDICRVGSTFGKNAKLPLACSIVWSHTSSINYPEEYKGKLSATLFGHGLSQELFRLLAFYSQVLNDDHLSPVAGPNGTLRFGTFSVDPSAKPSTSTRGSRAARAIDKSAVMPSSSTMQICNMLYQRRTQGANAN